jgi:hypothetical protein
MSGSVIPAVSGQPPRAAIVPKSERRQAAGGAGKSGDLMVVTSIMFG